jgi:CO dehydrogenase maturation factor
LRLAFVGKGGAGKSVICGTLARILARRHRRVLALDVDTMPGLAQSLGLGFSGAGNSGLPEELGEHQPEQGWVLREGEDVVDLVAQHAIAAPDGVQFLQLGKLPGQVKPGSTTVFRAILENFREAGWTLMGDLAAGTRQPFFGWGNFAEIVLIVVEPSAKAVLSAHRLAKLAGSQADEESPAPRMFGLVLNKVRTAADVIQIKQMLADTRARDLPILGQIPYDEQLRSAEQAGLAPIDADPEMVAVKAVAALADTLEQLNQESDQS